MNLSLVLGRFESLVVVRLWSPQQVLLTASLLEVLRLLHYTFLEGVVLEILPNVLDHQLNDNLHSLFDRPVQHLVRKSTCLVLMLPVVG